MVYIKNLSSLLTVFGILLTFVGLIPYIVQFPNSDLTASGPRNLWEVIIYFAYDGKSLFLSIGLIMLILGLFSLYKIKK